MFSRGRPENDPGNVSFEKVKDEYEHALRTDVQLHAQAIGSIMPDYDRRVEVWLGGDASSGFDRVAEAPCQAVEASLPKTQQQISADIDTFHDYFVRVIPPEDQDIWTHVQGQAQTFGPDSHWVDDALGAASSKLAREAMKAALDRQVWEYVQSQAQTFGPDSHWVGDALGAASSKLARKAMMLQLGGMRHESSHDSEDFFRSGSYEDFFKGAFGGGTFREAFEEEARRRRAGQSSSGQQQQQHQTRHEAPRRSNLDVEVAQIIQKVVSSDRQAGWLAGADRADIKRVISTVRAIRQKATEKGEDITDRHIYLRYRRLLERDDVNPQTEESFKILAAMMGNNPKGTLPF